MNGNIPIIGVDFSGAALAGEKIWVAQGQRENDSLQISKLERATNLPNGLASREEALAALVAWLQTFSSAHVGFDFPFALQKTNLAPNQNWRDWVLSLPAQYESSEVFRAAFSDERRKADIEAKTPFSPLNIRLYRQTFHGLRDVLAPLMADGATAVPFEAVGDGLVLMEICPASLLKREKLYLSYKGKSEAQRLNRELILSGISERFKVAMSDQLREKALADTEGDALDAVLAAVCVFKTKEFAAKSELEQFEGRVYF